MKNFHKIFKKIFIVLFIVAISIPAIGAKLPLNAFNTGEMSPLLEGRTDVAKYYSGCRTLENFTVLSYGGAQRRPGTKYIANAKSASAKCRLIPFEHSASTAYVAEMGNLYMRFYKDGAQITAGQIGDIDDWVNNTAYVIGSVKEDSADNTVWACTEAHTSAVAGTFADDRTGAAAGKWYQLTVDGNLYYPYEIETPYLTADLFEVKFIQSANWMYMSHPDYIPQKLVRGGDASWLLSDVSFARGPFLKQNVTAITVTGSATTGSITLTSNGTIFNTNHVGAHWQITHTVEASSVSGALSGNGSSSTVNVQLSRTFDFSTHGTWTGTMTLQRSYDAGSTWKDVLPIHYENDGNVTYTDIEQIDDAIYRVTMSDYGEGTCNFNLTARSFDLNGVVEITAFTSTSEVTATVENELGATTATKFWAEGAWSDDEGWPACLSFYEERLVFAATTNQPQTIWFSNIDDWEIFKEGDLDDDSMILTLAADQVNVIRWMAPQNSLMIGTISAEWQMSGSNSEATIAPLNVRAKRQSNYGSADLQGVMSNNVVLFAQRQARKVRELTYSFEIDAWVAPDMTVLSEHITSSGIVEMEFQKTPHPILWCVRDDGQLAAMTYMREQNVIGWHRHVTNTSNMTVESDIESVTVIPGTGEDEVWVSVERVINGSTVRYIEQIQPFDWGDDQSDAFFVDSGEGEIATAGAGGTCYQASDYPNLQFIENNLFETLKATTYFVADPGLTQTLEIANLNDLQDMNLNRAGNYYLSADIDATETSGWNGGTGFIPIGVDSNNKFTGTLEGNGFTIDGLTIQNTPLGYASLLGYCTGDSEEPDKVKVANLTLTNLNILGNNAYTGGIVARNLFTLVFYNCHVTGEVHSSSQSVGGLGGDMNSFIASNCTSTVNCSGGNVIGSLIGGNSGSMTITNCWATGNVSGANGSTHGGLIGSSRVGTISNSYATGNVTGDVLCGGFVGQSRSVLFTDCYATGNVTVTSTAFTSVDACGGFVGSDGSTGGGYLRCAAQGDVSADISIGGYSGGSYLGYGGFAGAIDLATGNSVTDCYAWGNVTVIGEVAEPLFPEAAVVLSSFIAINEDDDYNFTNCYAIGSLTGGNVQSGFTNIQNFYNWAGYVKTSCYWDTESSGIGEAAWSYYRDRSQPSTELTDPQITGYPTATMKTQSTYIGWDFDNDWVMGSACSGVYYWDGIYAGTGFGHLEGETVAILGDGIVLDKQTVTSGQFPLELDGIPQDVDYLVAGLPYNSRLKPMKLEMPSGPPMSGYTKRLTDVVLRLDRTLDVDVGTSWTVFDPMDFTYDEDGTTRSPVTDLFTGDMSIDFDDAHETGGNIFIQHDDPLPCTIIKLTAEFEAY